MNNEVQELVEKAVKIVSKTGNKAGTRYPLALKKIVISLRLDHGMSVRDIMKNVGVSSYSAREWPKPAQAKKKFNRVQVSNKSKSEANLTFLQREKFQKLKSIDFNLKVLIALIILLIFELIIIHLIF
ncbi:hypothetical protein N9O57_01590 [bacterium]|nr:hypothetical protein [bacterium]